MILGQGHGHDTPMGHGQQLCEILSSSNLAVRSYGPDTDFQYVCTVTLTLEIWPWVKVMTHPWVMDNNCVKLYPDRTREYEVMAQTRCEQTNRQTDQQTDRVIPTVYTPPPKLCLRRYKKRAKILNERGKYTFQFDNYMYMCEILSRSNLAVRSYGPDMDFGYVCTVTLTLELWPWVNVMTHPSVIAISEELWTGHRFPVYVHCDLDLGDMMLGQGHDTWLGHGQQLCQILSRSNLAVRSYGPDMDFQYLCTVTLTLEIWSWVKVMVMTHPWVMDNNCVKFYLAPTWQWGVMARTRISSMCALWPWPWRYDLGSRSWHTLGSWTTIVWNYIQIGQGSTKLWPRHDVNRQTDRQTNRQTGWFLQYIPPQNFVCGGIKRELKYSMKGANIHFNLTITCICVKCYHCRRVKWSVL